MIFTDTHCHIHDPEFFPNGAEGEYERARAARVQRMFCVGTDIASSQAAVVFAAQHPGCFAFVGVHPHDASNDGGDLPRLKHLILSGGVTGIGEIGLDYFYDNSPRAVQHDVLHAQLELACKWSLPVSFHVRDAFDDFWNIFDQYSNLRGVLHSFTDSLTVMERALERDLWIGVNGIATFARDRDVVTQAIPLEKILLETDAPYLTPEPLRGKINEPGNIPLIASYVAELRGITVEELSQTTEQSVQRLFF